jgi:Uma2 family endonuclease
MNILELENLPPLVLHFKPAIALNDEQFFDFCQLNRELRIERTASGEVLIMSPTGSETGGANFELIIELGIWTRQDGTGKGFDSWKNCVETTSFSETQDGLILKV